MSAKWYLIIEAYVFHFLSLSYFVVAMQIWQNKLLFEMFIAFCTFWWLCAMCAAAPFFTFSSCPPLRIWKLLKLLISKNHYAFLILLCSKFVIMLHVISHTGQNIRIECIHFRTARSTNQWRVENNFIADKRVVMEKLASANSWTKWYEVLLVC